MASVLKVDTVLESTLGAGTNFGGVGSASVPTLSIGSQTNKGFYDAGSNKIGVSVGGSKVGEIGVGYGGFTGNVIQVVNTIYTPQTNVAVANNTILTTGIVGSIATKMANSRIAIYVSSFGIVTNLSNYIYSIIYRHTSTWSANVTPVGTSLGMTQTVSVSSTAGNNFVITPHYQIDSPNQPAGTTLFYGNAISNNGGTTATAQVNYVPITYTTSMAYASITLMEIMA